MRTPIRISRMHNAKQLTSRGCPRPAKKVEDDDDVCTGPEGDWPLLETETKKSDLRIRLNYPVAVRLKPA